MFPVSGICRLTLSLALLGALGTGCRGDKDSQDTDSGGIATDDTGGGGGGTDADGDGYSTPDDCDDTDPAVNPGASETCDGRDEDCDGTVDEGVMATWYQDADDDGHGDPAVTTEACGQPDGYVASPDDCDDDDDTVYPGAAERCDGVDNNCNGSIDEEVQETWYADADGDGYGDAASVTEDCDPGDGWVADDTDCDDGDAAVNPAASEVCNGIDDDCDALVDDADDSLDPTSPGEWYADADGDGYGDAASGTQACEQPSGTVAEAGDCDDGDGAVNPGATEICDEADTDEDCDGLADDADPGVDPTTAGTWYTDGDGDGFGDAGAAVQACDQPSGTVADAGDCDNGDAAVNPGATEVCDEVDDDCDGLVDDADDDLDPSAGSTWYADGDGDGYGDPDSPVTACAQPTGTVADATDCNDGSKWYHPGAMEWCDGKDTDCDGTDDDPDARRMNTWYTDADSDGYGDAAAAVEICTQPAGTVADDSDCDDGDATVSPGATEVCDDGVDNDCDGGAEACRLAGDYDLADADAVLIGEDAGDGAGESVAEAGDVNGDGLADVLVGAPARGSATGTAYLVLGPVSGEVDLGAADAALVGEGMADYAAWAMGGGGDNDGDSYGDVLVSAYYDADVAGTAYLVQGPVSGDFDLGSADAIIRGTDASDYLGWWVDFVGDVDGDGHEDLLTTAPGSDDFVSEAGEALLFLGPISGELGMSDADARLYGTESGEWAGGAMARGGDIDADGFDDLVISGELRDYSGTDDGVVYLVMGPVSGDFDLAAADTILVGQTAGDEAGWWDDGGGDVNGDGYADVLTTAPYNSSAAGATYLMLGPVSAGVISLADAQAILVGENASDWLGRAGAFAGDLDGDGNDEIVLGAPYLDAAASDAGGAYLVHGPVTGAISIASADASFTGEASGDHAGWAVAGLGDTDGDGLDDFVVGADDADLGGSGSGAAYLVLGRGL